MVRSLSNGHDSEDTETSKQGEESQSMKLDVISFEGASINILIAFGQYHAIVQLLVHDWGITGLEHKIATHQIWPLVLSRATTATAANDF